MAKFKLIISDPKTGKSNTVELEGAKAQPLIGHKINDTVDGKILGVGFGKIKIMGGTDKDGIPMRPDIHGGAKKYVLISDGVGINPKKLGERKRKLVRGNTIVEETYQINAMVVE
ncbi:MAG: 30S ribosomal protein S6e [Candidatus Bathyarchaeia archaeon]